MKFNLKFLLTAYILFSGCHFTSEKKNPNVILILTDDQGYGDVGYHGNHYIQTPTIDSLATTGIRFSNFYVSPRCAPSRAALLTGRYPERTGVFHVTDGGYILAAEENTLAEYFKNIGYHTAIFGKWHIGDHFPYLPEDQGFDYSLIHKGGAIGQIADHPDNYWDMTIPISKRHQCYFNTTLHKNRKVYKAKGYVADVFTDHAIDFINENRDHPFFLYLPYNTPHDPYQVPEKYLEMYEHLDYDLHADSTNGSTHRLSDFDATHYVYAMMTNIDDNINRLIQKLNALSLAENTIIVYLSDNGPAQNRYNGNLRGKKGQVYEGGVRVPAFINYAELTPVVINMPAAHYDILPTLANLCELKLNNNIDGIDLLNCKNKINTERDIFIRESNYMESYNDIMIRKGNFKLVANMRQKYPAFQLFDLDSDPFETNDLSELMTEKVEALKMEMNKWYKDVISSGNLKIQPIIIGSEFENPVRLSRHELVTSYSNGWFSNNYLGYYLIKIVEKGNYQIKFSFREPLPNDGKLEMKIGPIGKKISIREDALYEIGFSEIFLPPGIHVFQAWFQNDKEVISPFYVHINKTENANNEHCNN